MFERAYDLFERYSDAPAQNLPAAAWEIPRRLRQMDYVLNRMVVTNTDLPDVTTTDFRTYQDATAIVETYAFSFYFLAWRVREVLRSNPFPGFAKFDPIGVRNVRNHLIEHPEKHWPTRIGN